MARLAAGDASARTKARVDDAFAQTFPPQPLLHATQSSHPRCQRFHRQLAYAGDPKQKDWEVYGMDIGSHKLEESLGNPRFKFVEGDITINREYIEYHVKKCDVVIPLVAIANPIQYVKDPLRVFELDFEANLAVVRQCAKYKKRIIFPSTSEVYGMSTDAKLDEETTESRLRPHRATALDLCLLEATP